MCMCKRKWQVTSDKSKRCIEVMYRQSGMKAIEVRSLRRRGQGNKYANDRGWRAEGGSSDLRGGTEGLTPNSKAAVTHRVLTGCGTDSGQAQG
jgi:hypothetical protein